jgi:hypothetical protein
MKSKIKYLVIGTVLVGSLLAVGTTFAAGPGLGGGMMGRARMPGVFGTVSSINGNTLTITSKGFGQNTTTTAYTVDATNAKITKNGVASTLSNVVVGDNVSVQGTVSGTNVTATAIRDGMMGGRGYMMGQKSGVFGTVASVSGNTLTVTSKMRPNGSTTSTTYTVDATNATVMKAGVSSSVSNIAVGDMVMVAGTVNGTSVVATTIRDGVVGTKTPPVSIIKGNGQPVIGGAVMAISGNTLTVTNKSNVTYTVDATNATIEKSNAVSSVSAITVGDNVVVQGAINGNSVTASSVIDGGTTSTTTPAKKGNGFFGTIGNFFHNLFGFF